MSRFAALPSSGSFPSGPSRPRPRAPTWAWSLRASSRRSSLPGIVSLPGRYEYGFHLSAGSAARSTSAFRTGGGETSAATRLVDGAWTKPEIVLSHPEHSFADPFLSRDGRRLYFISTQRRTPAATTSATSNVERTAAGRPSRSAWAARSIPVSRSYYVSFADDGTLAFASNRGDEGGSDFDIYLARPTESGFAEPQRLSGEALTTAYEADGFLARDGSYVLFASTRRAGAGGSDIYVSFRGDDGMWSRAIALGLGVNTPAKEFTPSVSPDGRYLFYSGDQDIYWVDASVIDEAKQRLAAEGG